MTMSTMTTGQTGTNGVPGLSAIGKMSAAAMLSGNIAESCLTPNVSSLNFFAGTVIPRDKPLELLVTPLGPCFGLQA